MAMVVLLFVSTRGYALEVIVNEKMPQQELSIKELRSIYAMRRTHWQDGTPIKLVVFGNDNEVHRQFCKQLLAVFPHQLQTRWDRLIYSGRATQPIVVSSMEDMLHVVASTEGAIGYMDDSSVGGSVRVLTVLP